VIRFASGTMNTGELISFGTALGGFGSLSEERSRAAG
jgi:hypothetical protein